MSNAGSHPGHGMQSSMKATTHKYNLSYILYRFVDGQRGVYFIVEVTKIKDFMLETISLSFLEVELLYESLCP